MAIALALCVSVGASACGGGSNSASTGGAINPDLKIAISFLPGGANASYVFEFGDWGPIEQELGYPASRLASGGGIAALGKEIDGLAGGVSPGGNTTFDLEPAGVGDVWSIADVRWDAMESSIGAGAGAPLAITAFRSGSVIPHVEQHLARCGFRSRSVEGMTLYSGAALKCVTPIGTGIPAQYNDYAFDTADRLVLQSASANTVIAAIANRHHGGSEPVLRAVLNSLGSDTQQLAVATGPQFCGELSSPAALAGRFGSSSPRTVLRAKRLFSDATRYLGFGFGYRYTSGAINGTLAFVYPSEAVARSDLSPRERMLRNGIDFSIGEPYSKLFLVRSGRTQGAAAIYQLEQPGNTAIRLGQAFENFDIGFARC